MTDKEILAELKRCYEYLVDIRDNADNTQISDETRKKIFHIENEISGVYNEVFNNSSEDMNTNDNLMVADEVYEDYYCKDEDCYVLKCDNGDYEWWNDRKFLYK